VRRVGKRFDLGGETRAALFTGVRIAAARALSDFPDDDAFEDLFDWYGPLLSRGARDVRADWLARSECVWEPVGTPEEYLRVNLHPPPLSYATAGAADGTPRAWVRGDVIVGVGAEVDPTAQLARTVVWARERVPAGTHAQDGVFAGGRFHPCSPARDTGSSAEGNLTDREEGKLRAEPDPGRSS
jgi:hypothetical protein